MIGDICSDEFYRSVVGSNGLSHLNLIVNPWAPGNDRYHRWNEGS